MSNLEANPLITIVIPVYNVENYLHKCVNSVINQTYTNLEIILVDDGSPDNCGKICDEYEKMDSRIKVIHKSNGGLSDARNAGIDIANGKYISFIDSDDYVDLDYIEFLYNQIFKYNTSIAICSHRVLYDTGKIIEKQTNEVSVLDSKKVLERILYDEGIDLSAWAKLYDINLFKDIRYPKGRLYEDSATTYLLIDKCDKIVIASKSKYNYMIRRNSITNNKFTTKKMDLIISTEEMANYIVKKYPDLKSAADRRVMYSYLSTLSQLANAKESHLNEEKKIITYIKANRYNVLTDKRTPKRDKLALLTTLGGYSIYKKFWVIYLMITGRK